MFVVLPLLIIGIILLAFSPQIASAVRNIISSKDSDVEKQQQSAELEKQARREDEGIFTTFVSILLGDKTFDEKPTVAKDMAASGQQPCCKENLAASHAISGTKGEFRC